MAINKPKIQVQVDIPSSIKQVNADLSQLEKQLKPINVSLNINSDTIKAQANQIQAQINNITKTSSTGIKIPINFNVSANEIKAQLAKIVGQIRNGDKGTVINYKVNLDKDNNFDSVMLKYRNEANEVTESLLKLGTAGNWNETIKSVSQNIEQTTKKAEQLTQAQQKFQQQLESFKTTVNSFGDKNIGSLLDNNELGTKYQEILNGLDSVNDKNGLSQIKNQFKELQTQTTEYITQQKILKNESDASTKSQIKDLEVLTKSEAERKANIQDTSNKVALLAQQMQILETNASKSGMALNQGTVSNFTNALNVGDIGKAQQYYRQLKLDVQQFNTEQKKGIITEEELTQQLGILQNRAQGAYGNFLKYVDQNSKGAKQFETQINEIKSSFQSLFKETDYSKAKTQFEELQSQVAGLKGEFRAAGLEGRSFGKELENSLQKFTSWIGIGTVVMTAVNAVKQMADNVRSLDKSMTDIQIASGLSNSEAQKLMNTYSEMGKTLGATTTEVADSADSYLRQGKSIAETNELVKDSTYLSKLGQIDSASATDYLTASMKGYGVQTSQAINIVDKLSAVDMSAAVSAGGLAEGMSKTASMASLAGVSMDKLIGYLAVVGETTQKSMDEVGTSFQAIFSRMGNVKAGKFVDDQTGESLNDVESVLGKVGIKLRDSQDSFRNFGNVIDDVGARWNSFTDVEKNAVSTAIAGTRQRENFTVLMQNYGNALKYSETAANSAGTATEKMTVYQNSLEAKTKAATAAFEELSKTIINGDIFKGVIDAGGTLSNVLTSIVKSGAGIPVLIASISSISSLMGKNAGRIYAPFLRVA